MDAAGLTSDGQAAVVLVNCAKGAELGAVRDVLTGVFRTPTVYLDGDDLGSTAMTLDPATGLLDVDGLVVRPAVVWVRHASPGALAARSGAAGSMRLLDAEAWSGFLARLTEAAAVALPGTAPAGAAQLTDARRLGVQVPRTVATTDVRTAGRRMQGPRLVVKVQDFRLFEPDRRRWQPYLPSVVDRDAVTATAGRRRPGELPFLVQEYVPHERELRVYHLDGGIGAFEVRKAEPAGPWTDPGAVDVTWVDCPAPVAATVLTLCSAWGLRYGAFDLLVRPDGEPVLLEANLDGDWLWFERRARRPGISFMAAVMVHELFVRYRSRGALADDRSAT